jgi:predicted ATP-dependent endonuclease of OLD family
MVVLVEGASDKAAILATAELDGIDFGALGVAILPVDGKSKLDRPAAIFRSFEIPTFVIWDCDGKAGNVSDADKAANHALQNLLGLPKEEVKDALSTIGSGFACFESALEETLKAEIGVELYQQQADVVKQQFGIQRNDDLEKAPFAMRHLLGGAAKAGKRSETLLQIVSAIVSMRESFFKEEREIAKEVE